MKELHFDVFGRVIAVKATEEGWKATFVGGDGKSRPAGFPIPTDLNDMKSSYYNNNGVGHHISVATQSRLRLPTLLPCIDRILWIDMDAFIVGPLHNIYFHRHDHEGEERSRDSDVDIKNTTTITIRNVLMQ